ncbi:MAG: hypothetical protein EOO05_15480 [Chitinophagaceae bacterium]|nr:MAG: hypothetical protein EOO05_15480 [Chitinophagaceae bacterium]
MNGLSDTFLLQYKGKLKIEEAGSYKFKLSTAAGLGSLIIDNKEIAFFKSPSGEATTTLPAGELPFELRYSKSMDWAKPSIGLSIAGPGIREFIISDQNGIGSEPVDPILINAATNTVLRSFIDIPQKRIVHAVSVGSPEGTHYTYDPENGAIVQVWHGGFLDATPMWHERGDGSSRAMGSVEYIDLPAINITTLQNPGVTWKADTTGTGFRPNGYRLDQSDRPTFRYTVYGRPVQDSVWLPASGGISRQISFGDDRQGTANEFVFRVAVSDSIVSNGDNLFTIGDKQWYIRVNDDQDTKLSVRTIGTRRELLATCKKQLRYTIIF